jgi:hypothetical protein
MTTLMELDFFVKSFFELSDFSVGDVFEFWLASNDLIDARLAMLSIFSVDALTICRSPAAETAEDFFTDVCRGTRLSTSSFSVELLTTLSVTDDDAGDDAIDFLSTFLTDTFLPIGALIGLDFACWSKSYKTFFSSSLALLPSKLECLPLQFFSNLSNICG